MRTLERFRNHVSVDEIDTGTHNVIDARGQSIHRGVHDGVAFANFKAHKFSYLNITSLGTDHVLNGTQCGVACVNIPSCFSFNLAAFYDINGRMLCELLSSDKYNNSDKFISSQSFHHFSIVVSALMSACLKEVHFHKFFIYSFLVKYCLPYSLLNRKTWDQTFQQQCTMSIQMT